MSQNETNFHHLSVLSQELMTGLNIIPNGHYLDATVGGGGHSALILTEKVNENPRLLKL